jgi:hypothetical protein
VTRRSRLLGSAAALAAAVAALVLTGGASATSSSQARLVTAADAAKYLRSLGVDPRGVVIQRGVRNYAGPRCPGSGWSCTTARRVLQTGGENRVECTPGTASSTAGTQSCEIVQNNPDARNEARCKEHLTADSAVQVCSIMQTGIDNKAHVDQAIESRGGPTQDASQTATVTQSGATEKNEVHVTQSAKQATKVGPSQTQEAHQAATVTQEAVADGSNQSHVDQDQDQKAHGGTTQLQNASFSSSFGDCNPFALGPFQPNVCANVTQTADAGDNDNHLRQSVDEDANAQDVAVQRQGSFGGGIDGRVHSDSETGTSTNDANQKKSQTAKAPDGSFQTQIDPTSCCGFASAQGNDQSRETIDQSSRQDASEGLAFQTLSIIGTSSSTAGSCEITHHARNNVDSSNTTATQSPCVALELQTTCTSGGGDVEGRRSTQGRKQEEVGCFSFEGFPDVESGRG